MMHVSLDYIRFQLSRMLDDVFVRQMTHSDWDTEARRMVVSINGFLLGQELDPVVTASYPATWWQHFKLRWFPRWALNRWPVEFKKVHTQFSVVYPDFKPALPDERRFVIHRTSYGYDDE